MTESSNNSKVLYQTGLHPIVFFVPTFLFLISFALLLFVPMLQVPALIFGFCMLVWLAMTWVTYHFSSLTIQKKQVILRTGLLVRQTVDIPLTKVETIDIRQSVLGSLFQYGTLIITGTGGTRHFMNNLLRPLTCRRYMEQTMNNH